MIKREPIIADDVFQKIWDWAYKKSFVLMIPETEIDIFYLSESPVATDEETFVLAPWQSIEVEYEASQKETNFYIKWKTWNKYQIISI